MLILVAPPPAAERRCRICGCIDRDCTGCVVRTGEPCHWVEDDLCSACVPGSGGLASTLGNAVAPAWPPAFSAAPWSEEEVDDYDLEGVSTLIVGADGFDIGLVYDRPDAPAVAAAICALPELLAAANDALVALVDATSDHPNWRGLKAAREQLERALARARNTAPGRSED